MTQSGEVCLGGDTGCGTLVRYSWLGRKCGWEGQEDSKGKTLKKKKVGNIAG